MSKNTTMSLIIGFIEENDLYNFNSLSDKTQKKIKEAYGPEIETDINSTLNVMRGGVTFLSV